MSDHYTPSSTSNVPSTSGFQHSLIQHESQGRSHADSHVHNGSSSEEPRNRRADSVISVCSGRSTHSFDVAKPAFARTTSESSSVASVRRRVSRVGIFRTVDSFGDFTARPGWHRLSPLFLFIPHFCSVPLNEQPRYMVSTGLCTLPKADAEPGVDPSKPDGGHSSMLALSARCGITVVGFSRDSLSIQRLDNKTPPEFLD